MKINCMMSRLKLYTHHLAVRFNEDFSIPLTCKNLLQMCCRLCNMLHCGLVVKLVDMPDLGSGAEMRVGSSPIQPTKSRKKTSFNFLNKSYQRIWIRGERWTLPLGCIRSVFLLGK